MAICPDACYPVNVPKANFEWDSRKDRENQEKHGISFSAAQFAFMDPSRVIAMDLSHGAGEKRYFCFGQVQGGILTVRFTFRGEIIRIFGAGYWRKGKAIYERENKIHG
jgi:uncharacterized DUF497 family protein